MDVFTEPISFAGRAFSPKELKLIREVISDFAGLTRMELAHTVCELLNWRRPRGSLKGRECREFLERLDAAGLLTLPDKRSGRPVGSVTRVPVTKRGEPADELTGSVREVGPVLLEAVKAPAERELFRELVGRYHYLGHKVPFGAHLRYLVWVSRPEPTVVGCVQVSSTAWRMAARDRWIGWSDEVRRVRLQHVVNNSRFLILPWVKVKNLASSVLALVAKRVKEDWPERYAVEPLLLETLVDPARYRGTCYLAANWLQLGETSGRGRMDRKKERVGAAPKLIFVYPLVRDVCKRLERAVR